MTIRRTVTFLISDFIAVDYEQALRSANKRHDIVAVTVTDPREIELPKVGIIALEDAETGEKLIVDTNSRRTREEYRRNTRKAIEERGRIFRSTNVDAINVTTHRPFTEPLLRFFRMREKRLLH